jgi:hypothetical protein
MLLRNIDYFALPDIADSGEINGSHYIVQEFVDGKDLAEEIITESNVARIITDPERVRALLPQIAGIAFDLDQMPVSLLHSPVSSQELFDDEIGKKILSDGKRSVAYNLITQDQLNQLIAAANEYRDRLVHVPAVGDYSLQNLRLASNGRLYLLDYEYGGKNNYAKGEDITTCFHRLWTIQNQPDLARQLLDEYRKLAGLSQLELSDLIIPILIRKVVGGMRDHIERSDISKKESHQALVQIILNQDWKSLFP